MDVLSTEAVQVMDEGSVVDARRIARDLAQRCGFDAFATAAVTTATSELARNVLVHGGGGCVTLNAVAEGGRCGLLLEFRDRGPGIADLERALQGGYSTKRSLGLGLSGSRRLVDDFQIDSGPDGTTVRVLKWGRFGR